MGIHVRRLAPGMALLALAFSASPACGQDEGPTPPPGAGDYSHELAKSDHREVAELPDGRRVAVAYDSGRGLVEQHYSPEAKAWSAPHMLYETEADPCQSLSTKVFGDSTVAVIANFGLYCSDGEPPEESIAAVAAGQELSWDTNLTRDFDGWDKVTADGGPEALRFTNGSVESVTELRWVKGEGFFDVKEIPR